MLTLTKMTSSAHFEKVDMEEDLAVHRAIKLLKPDHISPNPEANLQTLKPNLQFLNRKTPIQTSDPDPKIGNPKPQSPNPKP